MNGKVKDILESAKPAGWVVEPLAMEILRGYDLPVVNSYWARTLDDALEGGEKIGFPLVAKVVSPKIMHKSEAGGVAAGIADKTRLREVFLKMAKLPGFEGVLLEEMAKGVELIVGSKLDGQFGAVLMVGIGGTSVEVYKDVALRMAPITEEDGESALDSLKGKVFLEGFRGAEVVNKKGLVDFMVRFSKMAHELSPYVESIDLNPVFCNKEGCRIADARMILPSGEG